MTLFRLVRSTMTPWQRRQGDVDDEWIDSEIHLTNSRALPSTASDFNKIQKVSTTCFKVSRKVRSELFISQRKPIEHAESSSLLWRRQVAGHFSWKRRISTASPVDEEERKCCHGWNILCLSSWRISQDLLWGKREKQHKAETHLTYVEDMEQQLGAWQSLLQTKRPLLCHWLGMA